MTPHGALLDGVLAARSAYNQPAPRPVNLRRAVLAMRDVMADLSAVLFAYQRESGPQSDDERLGKALNAVLDQRVRPVLAKRLRPDDVDDVVSEVRIAVWRYRYSIRAEEAGRFIHAIAHRKLADALRVYYKEAALSIGNPETEAGELLALLPAAPDNPQDGDDQRVWELLKTVQLTDLDLLVAYLLFLGLPKGEIAQVLGISPNTVTNALKRCREQLSVRGAAPPKASVKEGAGGER